jgi:DNA invertase Pin-like site-specific DNA recombinase
LSKHCRYAAPTSVRSGNQVLRIFSDSGRRPKGSKSKVKKLTGKEAEIKKLLDKKVSKSAIARILGVHRLTVAKFVEEIEKMV